LSLPVYGIKITKSPNGATSLAHGIAMCLPVYGIKITKSPNGATTSAHGIAMCNLENEK
jgi:hypothetical protein